MRTDQLGKSVRASRCETGKRSAESAVVIDPIETPVGPRTDRAYHRPQTHPALCIPMQRSPLRTKQQLLRAMMSLPCRQSSGRLLQPMRLVRQVLFSRTGLEGLILEVLIEAYALKTARYES